NFGNGLASTLMAWGWGHRYHDLGPLRLIRRQALERMQMGDRGFGWTVEMQARAVELGLRICELPVNYRPRQGGQSKISGTLSGSVKAGVIILTTLARLYAKTLVGAQGFAPDARTFRTDVGAQGSAPRDAKAPHPPMLGEPDVQTPPTLGDLGRCQPASELQNAKGTSQRNQWLLFLSAALLIWGSVWSLPHGDFLNDPRAVPQFWQGMGVMGVGFMLSWGLRSLTAAWFWGVAIATRLILLAMYPGDDIWRYLWEGLLQTQGISPYDYAPNAELLVPLRTAWWPQINHPDISAIYPPVAQFGFRLLAHLSPSVVLFKAAFTVADLGICWLLSRRFSYGATLFYAWNPLVIYSFAGGGHYDSWFLLPLVAAWFWFERPYGPALDTPPPWHWLGSALLLGISIAVKWVSLPILGFLAWQSLRRGKGWLALGVLVAGALPLALSAVPFCSLQACPLIPTGSSFVNYGRSAELIPHVVALVWADSQRINPIFSIPLALLVFGLLRWTKRFAGFSEGYLMGLLMLSPIVHGWYFTWLVPFGVASRNLGIRLLSLSAFIYFALPYRLALGQTGWTLTPLERWGLWLPLLIGVLTPFAQRLLRPGSVSPRLM
ncbi:MAG: glycosyltransferase family 2 protein, partial [Cyanobacteria bacterium]|nr:glycosyltransferase family 2 protein [Cyanobacteriota bacterium]